MAKEGRESDKSGRQPQGRQNAKSGRRFRLSEMFSESGGEEMSAKERAAQTQRDLDERAHVLGVKLPPPVSQDVLATANRVYDTTPRASVQIATEVDSEEENANAGESLAASFLSRATSKRKTARASRIDFEDEFDRPGAPALSHSAFNSQDLADDTLSPDNTLTWNGETTAESPHSISPAASGSSTSGFSASELSTMRNGENIEMRATSMNGNSHLEEALYAEIEQLRGGMEEMYRVMTEMQERGDAQDKVFNTLHSELQDYKNDFIYEHMKPVVRPLLFLFDHMEQFENELSSQRNGAVPSPNERRLLSPDLMCENVSFFREQLVEALRICEVTPMKQPQGEVDSRLHKVVETVSTDAAGHNMIQRVVRSGWYLNGRVLRPAEVVVGANR
jgi:molecular chaperone GrpE (heat shock protein)